VLIQRREKQSVSRNWEKLDLSLVRLLYYINLAKTTTTTTALVSFLGNTKIRLIYWQITPLRKPIHGREIKPRPRELDFFTSVYCFMALLCVSYTIYFILLWHDSLFMLKVPFNANQLNQLKVTQRSDDHN